MIILLCFPSLEIELLRDVQPLGAGVQLVSVQACARLSYAYFPSRGDALMSNEEIVAPIAADALESSDADVLPARRPGLFAPLRRRNFSLLFSGQLISTLGDAAYTLALPWTVLAVTGDPRQMAIVLAAEAVARVLMLLIGGALADRLSPRIVLLAADLGRLVVLVVLGVALFAGLPPRWIVALVAGLQGAGSGLFQPGVGALIPRTVSEGELPGANGLMQIIQFLSLAFGPLLGGIATAAQASVAFLADASSFLISALTLFGIRLPKRAMPVTTNDTAEAPLRSGGMLRDIGAGLRATASACRRCAPRCFSLRLVTLPSQASWAWPSLSSHEASLAVQSHWACS